MRNFIGFPKPTPKATLVLRSPRHRNMDDEEYAAAAWEGLPPLLSRARHLQRVSSTSARDFAFVVSCFQRVVRRGAVQTTSVSIRTTTSFGSGFVLTLDNGDHVFDCSLCEPFNSKLILAKIKKRWDELEMSSRKLLPPISQERHLTILASTTSSRANTPRTSRNLLDRPL